ncbi:serine/threonine-protein kinase [Dyadobacter psychrotolerans]|uniref:Serine/threonine-protein kinase n=1 Tax=Dyadobacter psychrotolerans TaxID=2541721 RepID=A0A4R5D4G6_9BACT|nr:serine/threonine-protein kinase [Dyadobacter psychrotolerans]TDE08299.1 serine/threonine-protein kinase [Dyadobacter psychrotolerans]
MNPENYKTITFAEFSNLYEVNFGAIKGDDDFLGSGGYGSVYKGYDVKGHQEVAIKKSATDKNLLDEVLLGSAVPKDKNIARYLIGYRVKSESENFDVAILQYYPKGNLDNLFFNRDSKVTLTPEQTDAILLGILSGLKFLHEGFLNSEGKHVSITHRDLKPHNILIAERRGQFIPLITDFGISKAVVQGDDAAENFEKLSSGRGTGPYKSPEQILGTGSEFYSNLDLWAFGVMLFKILTKRLPFYSDLKPGTESFDRDIELKITQFDLENVYAQVSEKPDKYQKVIRRCLVRDFRERAQSAVELINILEEIPEQIEKAKQLLEGGDLEEAKVLLKRLELLRPDYVEVSELVSRYESLIQQEIEIKKKLRVAEDYLAKGALEEAQQVYVSILESDGGRVEAKEGLVKVNELIKEAKELQEKAAKIEGLMDLAYESFAKQNYIHAITLFENVLSMDADHAAARPGIEKCLAKMNEVNLPTDSNDGPVHPEPLTDEKHVVVNPTIKTFKISPDRVKPGNTIMVSWQVDGDSDKIALRSAQFGLNRWVGKSGNTTIVATNEAELALEVHYRGEILRQESQVRFITTELTPSAPKKAINKLFYAIPVVAVLLFFGVKQFLNYSAKQRRIELFYEKELADGRQADSLFTMGQEELAQGTDKDVVSETYFKKAVFLKPVLADSAFAIFFSRAQELKEDSVGNANYLQLANYYRNIAPGGQPEKRE